MTEGYELDRVPVLSRRRLLGGMAGAVLLSVAGCGGGSSGSGAAGSGNEGEGSLLRSTAPLPPPFAVPLVVPPVLAPTRTAGGTDYYTITARSRRQEILPGLQTEVRGYEGIFPGPTIESRRGRPIVVRHRNELAFPEVVHLHGGHTPPDSDGYPTDLVLPAGGWAPGPHQPGHGHDAAGSGTAMPHGTVVQTEKDYTYPLQQRAATLWYHDHRMDFTGPAVWSGLAAFHLIRDDEEDGLPLPRGDRELPLMITDRAFGEDGSMTYPALDPGYREPGVVEGFHNGVLGDVLLVNGVPWPFLEVAPQRYRLRILNACNARRLRLGLDPKPPAGDPFVQIGGDGGLLAAPQSLQNIYVTPAERFDVVVDFAAYPAGTAVTLTNELADGALGRVMQFRITRRSPSPDDTRIPARLSEVEPLDPGRAVQRREFAFNQANRDGRTVYLVQDQLFDPTVDLALPQLGTVEVWRLTSSTHHPIHLHLNPFQVVGREGGLQEEDAGWKDTVRLQPNRAVEIAVRFEDYRGRYVFHCHNLEHEDMAMMANFRVT